MKLKVEHDNEIGAHVTLPDELAPPVSEIKPGRKTSEAVATLIGLAASLAVAKGWLTSDDADLATRALIELIGVVGAVAIPALYTLYRTLLKLAAARKADCK